MMITKMSSLVRKLCPTIALVSVGYNIIQRIHINMLYEDIQMLKGPTVDNYESWYERNEIECAKERIRNSNVTVRYNYDFEMKPKTYEEFSTIPNADPDIAELIKLINRA